MKTKAIFCWSGGKDSALAFYRVINGNKFDIVSLLTTLNWNYKRVSMHGVREELLDEQARSMGISLAKVWVKEGSNAEYEAQMGEMLTRFKNEGVTHVIFGDIFLEDLRAYRESNLAKLGLQASFPLWKQDTAELIKEFLSEGFETVTCCVNSNYLHESFVGRKVDKSFIASLPLNVDPCGENGEFHTFCYKGPIFKKPIAVEVKEKLFKAMKDYGVDEPGGFWFAELEKIQVENLRGPVSADRAQRARSNTEKDNL